MSSAIHARLRVNFFFVVALILLSSVSVADPLFDEPSYVFEIDVPVLCETADFNDDGNMDFLVTSCAPYALNTFLGEGDGTFSFFQQIIPFNIGTISVCKLNSDPYPDLVVGNGENEPTIQTYLGDGSGGFQLQEVITHYHYSVNTGDLNGDGYSDLLLPYNITSHFWIDVYLCDGNGSFIPDSSYEVENIGFSHLIFVPGDLNGDGFADVAFIPLTSYRIGILLGNGDGTLQEVYYTVSSYYYCEDFATIEEGDFNEDGFLDLVATAGNGYAKDLVSVNDGSGGFSTSDSLGNQMQFVVAEDFDLDGHIDLAGSHVSIRIFQGLGDGTFGGSIYYKEKSDGQLGVADFDNDGDMDLVRLNYGYPLYKDSVYVYLNNTIQLGIEDTPSAAMGAFPTLTNSENPVSGYADIILNLPVSSHCLVSIFDIHGRDVETILDRNLGVGEHVLSWDSGELPQGCYTVMLSTELGRVCTRFVKVD